MSFLCSLGRGRDPGKRQAAIPSSNHRQLISGRYEHGRGVPSLPSQFPSCRAGLEDEVWCGSAPQDLQVKLKG